MKHRATRRIGLALVVAAAVLLLGACGGGGGSDEARLPDLRVARLDGTGAEVGLRSLVGEPLVVNLWAPWCVPCRREMPAFEQVHAATPGVRFVGLASRGDRDASLEFAQELGVGYDLLIDATGDAFSELGASSLPMTLFVDADGRIVDRHLGELSETALRAEVGKLLDAGA